MLFIIRGGHLLFLAGIGISGMTGISAFALGLHNGCGAALRGTKAFASRRAWGDSIPLALRPRRVSALSVSSDSKRYNRAVVKSTLDQRSTRPKFPSIDLSRVPGVSDDEMESFKSKYVNMDKLEWDSIEGLKRVSRCRELQYTRWRWACENLSTYVNILRVSGHSDTVIRNMLDGTPMCFKSPEDFRLLRFALRTLAKEIEYAMGWENVNFIMTGSSVPGFSQNPLKGHANVPSKITSKHKSDVDICVVGSGIDTTMLARIEAGLSEPRRRFPTTCTENSEAIRFGCLDLTTVCKPVADFKEQWELKLAGGLQFTFCEHENPTPPWETRIDIENVDAVITKS